MMELSEVARQRFYSGIKLSLLRVRSITALCWTIDLASTVRYACVKAAKIQAVMAKMLPNEFAPRNSKRRLIECVTTSVHCTVLRYGALQRCSHNSQHEFYSEFTQLSSCAKCPSLSYAFYIVHILLAPIYTHAYSK